MNLKTVAFQMSALLLALTTASVQAAIVDHGGYLTDTQSGLDWMDITPTLGLSQSQVVYKLANDSAFSGWRQATQNEVFSLFYNVTGLTMNGNIYRGFNDVAAFDDLLTLLGPQTSNPAGVDVRGVYGWVNPLGEKHSHLLPRVVQLVDQDPAPGSTGNDPQDFVWSTNYSQWTLDTNFSNYGAYLVREVVSNDNSTVPEPGSLVLLGLGLAGLAGLRRCQASL